MNNLKNETARLNKLRETIQRKLRNVEDGKSETEQQRDVLKSQITALDRGKTTHTYACLVRRHGVIGIVAQISQPFQLHKHLFVFLIVFF